MRFDTTSPSDRSQGRLLLLAALFLFLYSLVLTLSPAGVNRSWEAALRWDHWIGFAAWVGLFAGAHRQTSVSLPDRDPFLLPLGGLLSGWGMLTIWRLFPAFGLRQTLWLAISVLALVLLVRLPNTLPILRRYKYIWLSLGLLLTGLTFLIGTNPAGVAFSRLWLGGVGLYFQPSEPLKLFLVVYLAAYLAGSNGSGAAAPVLRVTRNLLTLLAPTILMGGLALLLLLFQRDLGTAFIFVFLYTSVAFVASGRKILLLVGTLAGLIAGAAGYLIFDVVRIRVDAWINPWLDPSGRSYQIVQSLLSVANGGFLGRGPGMGSPRVVPVAHSDFVFTSIVEEGGLLAAAGLLLLLAILVGRGMRAALCAPNIYQRYLAAGLTTFLVAQALLIIGGNIRMLPLTGVTLPFVSYGGSSLLTSFAALALLLHISSQDEHGPPITQPMPYLFLSGLLLVGLAAAALLSGWWAIVRAPDLLSRADNPRRAISDRYVWRGSILDRGGTLLVENQGETGTYQRTSLYPPLSLVTGYNHPLFGQAGLEASMDDILRGSTGHSSADQFWNQVLYGQPSSGQDIRLSIDLGLQQTADEMLADRHGSLVLLNSQTGDILALASHPNFDPNRLDETWNDLLQDENAPLLNRATQGVYQAGPALGPLLLAAYYDPALSPGELPFLPPALTISAETALEQEQDCALPPSSLTWGAVIAAGCPRPVSILAEGLHGSGIQGNGPTGAALIDLFSSWGLYSAPSLRLPASSSSPREVLPASGGQALPEIIASPLQVALAAAALSSEGVRPGPRLVTASNTPNEGWKQLPSLSGPVRQFDPDSAQQAALSLAAPGSSIWQSLASAANGPEQVITWFLGGTLPEWEGNPLALVLVIEEYNPTLAQEIGQKLLLSAMQP